MRQIDAARRRLEKQGPCAFCGGPFAAHRVIDAQMGRVMAGDPIEEVAEEYGELSVADMVARWIAYNNAMLELVLNRRANA